ncbi:hypothetical protein BGX26_005496 [Mortierella sp. AD094]|nr:hypothetical protein BGX26_005496 [Mortierella sp. AD094]
MRKGADGCLKRADEEEARCQCGNRTNTSKVQLRGYRPCSMQSKVRNGNRNSQVSEAIRLMREGVSTRETVRRLKISSSTIANIHSDNKENMPVIQGGYLRTVTAVEHIKLDMKRGTHRTAVEATKEANHLHPQPITVFTIRRY